MTWRPAHSRPLRARGPGQDAHEHRQARARSPPGRQRRIRARSCRRPAAPSRPANRTAAGGSRAGSRDRSRPRQGAYNLGILHRDRDDIFEAEVYLRRAIEARSGHDRRLSGAGRPAVRRQAPAAGVAKIYEEALERAPNRLPLLHNLAKTRMMLKEARRGRARWRAASSRSTTASRRPGRRWPGRCCYQQRRPARGAGRGRAGALRLAPDAPYGQSCKEQALQPPGPARRGDAACGTSCWRSGAKDWDKARPYSEVYYWLNRPDRCRAIADGLRRRQSRPRPTG